MNPKDGYGPVNPQAIIEIPKERINNGKEVPVGQVLDMQSKDGQTLRGVITEVKDNSYLVDFNHPLAGKVLNFDVHVVSVDNP